MMTLRNIIIRRRRCIVLAGMLLIAMLLLAVLLQQALATPDLRRFDPEKMGRIEASMWRSYYEGRWLHLGKGAMAAACGQYGAGWWDGLWLSWHAARAAQFFRTNSHDRRSLQHLEKYYAIIKRTAQSEFDIVEAAQLEHQWWKQRRQHVAPVDYAGTIAELTGLVYGVPEEAVLEASVLRAEAMAYRDARRNRKMTQEEWEEVSRQLILAYRSLKEGIASTGLPEQALFPEVKLVHRSDSCSALSKSVSGP